MAGEPYDDSDALAHFDEFQDSLKAHGDPVVAGLSWTQKFIRRTLAALRRDLSTLSGRVEELESGAASAATRLDTLDDKAVAAESAHARNAHSISNIKELDKQRLAFIKGVRTTVLLLWLVTSALGGTAVSVMWTLYSRGIEDRFKRSEATDEQVLKQLQETREQLQELKGAIRANAGGSRP